MLSRDIIVMAISISLATIAFVCLFRIAKADWQPGLHRTGFILGFIGAIGFTVIIFIKTLSGLNGWYGELSMFVLSSCLAPLITLAISWKWELIGGSLLIIGILILGVLPYGTKSLPEFTTFVSVLYQLSCFTLLLSGILIIHAWRVNQTLTPEKRYKNLRNAGLFIGIVTSVVLTPTFLTAAFGFAMGEHREFAVIMLIILLLAVTVVSLAWKIPCISGWILIVVGIINLFTLFAMEPYFIWELPLLADIAIVSLLPVLSGIFLFISCREESYIHGDYLKSTNKLMELTRKEIIERRKKRAEKTKG